MASYMDLLVDKAQHSFSEPGNTTAGILTVTHAAVAGRCHSIVKVDASYSASTVSGLLTVFFGATEKGRKYIHGSGALDFSADVGLFDVTPNEAVSATLDSGGGGVVGTIVISGYETAP